MFFSWIMKEMWVQSRLSSRVCIYCILAKNNQQQCFPKLYSSVIIYDLRSWKKIIRQYTRARMSYETPRRWDFQTIAESLKHTKGVLSFWGKSLCCMGSSSFVQTLKLFHFVRFGLPWVSQLLALWSCNETKANGIPKIIWNWLEASCYACWC